MSKRYIPFTKDFLEDIIKNNPTPFHIYDEKAIIDNAKEFVSAFSWTSGFKEYFAVKALPNPYILKLLASLGFGADCSSMSELMIADIAGIKKENIMFTSNNTPIEEFSYAMKLGAIINFDDITHIEYFEKYVGILPELVSFRYNPGPLKDGNKIIGKPEEAKYGLTTEQMKEAYKIVKLKGVKRFGMHTMVASNELNTKYFTETALILFNLAKQIEDEIGVNLEFINLGGGVGIPYKPNQKKIEWQELSIQIKKCYDSIFENRNNKPKIFFELGRAITGPYGYLVTKVIHEKNIYKKYKGVDACMVNLMRPGMYGAYHHITVAGKEDLPLTEIYDISGSLCENNDKFALDRKLPKIDIGDILIIHDTGAHGHAMGFNYNGKLRSAELLLRKDNSVSVIRRAETIEDLFSTLKV